MERHDSVRDGVGEAHRGRELGVEAHGADIGRVETPRGVVKFDPTFNKDVELLHGTAAVRVPVAAAAKDFTLRVTGSDSFTIFCISASIFGRSSGVNGRS